MSKTISHHWPVKSADPPIVPIFESLSRTQCLDRAVKEAIKNDKIIIVYQLDESQWWRAFNYDVVPWAQHPARHETIRYVLPRGEIIGY